MEFSVLQTGSAKVESCNGRDNGSMQTLGIQRKSKLGYGITKGNRFFLIFCYNHLTHDIHVAKIWEFYVSPPLNPIDVRDS